MQLETFFPYRLAVAAEAFSRNLVAVYGRTYGLSRDEWRLLFLIEGAGQISSPDLAKRSTLGKVQISRADADILMDFQESISRFGAESWDLRMCLMP